LPSNQANTFYRKPISNTIEEAEEIITLANEYNVKGQVGHVERFNPAFIATKNMIENPMFIETHRLAEFNSWHRCSRSFGFDDT
jgi:predicted dehydrogenase